MELDYDKFEQEIYQLLAIYKDLKIRKGAEQEYNCELVSDAIDILNKWEKILILSEIDEPSWTKENVKIINTIKEQMKTLIVLRKMVI